MKKKQEIKTLNKPFIANWMNSQELEFRINVEDYLLKAAELGLLQGRHIKNKTIFPTGETSVVFKIETEAGTSVVKMTKNPGILEAESAFLQLWSTNGVKTPTIIKLHTANERFPTSILSMEFIDAPMLEDETPQSRIHRGISREIGKTLAKMHRITGEGFGQPIINNKIHGTFNTLREEIVNNVLGTQAEWLLRQGIIKPDDLLVAETALNILENDLKEKKFPSLTHNDMGMHNAFATNPIPVFDPIPLITHPYLCLALCLIVIEQESNDYGKQESVEILLGYSKISPVVSRSLDAAIYLKSIEKLYPWSKKGKKKSVAMLHSILIKTKDKLNRN